MRRKHELYSKVLFSRTCFIQGQKPRIIRQQQFLNAYIFSAACSDKNKTVGCISPVCNREPMQIYLDMISQSIEEHAVILLDGAEWYLAKAMIIPKNITLLKLPPYSPKLNPKENF